MVSFGINSIPAKFNTLNYCIRPVENGDLFIKSWDGLESTWYAAMLKWNFVEVLQALICALPGVCPDFTLRGGTRVSEEPCG
jgi:hypothetical protein